MYPNIEKCKEYFTFQMGGVIRREPWKYQIMIFLLDGVLEIKEEAHLFHFIETLIIEHVKNIKTFGDGEMLNYTRWNL